MNFILYFKIAMILVVVVLSLFLSDVPKDMTTKKVGIIVLNIAIPIFFMIIMLFFIRKRKQFPALITSFFVLWFSNDQIQLLLSIVTILLFLLKPTRDYFRGVNTIEPESASQTQEQLQLEGADGEALPEPLPKPQSRSRKDPEVYIREATPEDADTIHALMHIAFEEYRTAIPPSSALEETSESILEALRDQGESAAILYEDDTATAMVRFKYVDDAIYFFRLSVIPARRKRGYARQLVKWIEKQGVTKGMNISRCKVRQSVQNNLVLYQNMGYEIVNQELVVRPAGTVKALTVEKKLGIS
jgi:ribosomal protein S18 acetylase RimI-like enzyme